MFVTLEVPNSSLAALSRSPESVAVAASTNHTFAFWGSLSFLVLLPEITGLPEILKEPLPLAMYAIPPPLTPEFSSMVPPEISKSPLRTLIAPP